MDIFDLLNMIGGLALFLYGMNAMGNGLSKMAGGKLEGVLERLTSKRLFAVLLGAGVTAVIQSSSATTVMVVGFVNSGIMKLNQTVGIIMGANIGTTITALLASIGQPKDAKRTAIAHCLFNISGCLLFIWFVKPYAALIQYISPKGAEIEVISRQIANAHTFFNVTMTLIWIPLIWLMVKIVMKVIPEGKTAVYSNSEAMYLDSRLVGQPTAALQLVVKEIVRCTEMVGTNLKELISVLEKSNSEKVSEVIKNSEDTRSLYNRITEYLAELFASGNLTEEQATQTAGVMCVLSDVDRMGALCREIAFSLKDKEEKKYQYSEKAMDDLKNSLQLIQKMYLQAVNMMTTGNAENAKKIVKQKEQIMDLGIKMRKSHVQRVGKGKCVSKLTEPFNKIIHSVDRMGNCCINMVDAVQGQIGLRYFLEYLDYDVKEV